MDESRMALPTVDEYKKALATIESETYRAILSFHHEMPARAVTATILAHKFGWGSYGAANLHYGKLAVKMADELQLNFGNNVALGLLVDFIPPRSASNEHYVFVMRENVARAIEDLGWVPRVANYLYPDLALQHAKWIDAPNSGD